MSQDLSITPRDRVLAAIGHQETDRPPVGDMGFFNWEKLSMALAVTDYEQGMQVLGLDLRAVSPPYIGPRPGVDEAGLELDLWGAGQPGTYAYGSRGRRPLAQAETVADVEAFAWPDPDWFDYGAAAEAARSYGGRYAIRGPGWSPIFCTVCSLMGMQRALELLASKPAVIEAAVERLESFYTQFHTRFLDATAGLVDIFSIGDDFAHDKALIINPKIWRRLFKPPIAGFYALAKSRGLRTWFHCCGAMREIIPDLVECGLDVLEPCQVHLPSMEPDALKRDFGRHITFFGAINTQDTLPHGTPEQVRAEVRERVAVLGRGGGYIVSSDHTVLEDVPVENVLAMYQAAGSYMLGG